MTNLVHGSMIRRVEKSWIKSAFNSSVYVDFVLGNGHGCHGRHIMSATLSKKGCYVVTDNQSGQQLATVRLVFSCPKYVMYIVTDQFGVTNGAITYEVPSMLKALRDGPARTAQYYMVDPLMEGNVELLSQKNPNWFHDLLMKHASAKGGLLRLAGHPHVIVIGSAVPQVDSVGRAILNFNGRGTEPSPKNMQIGTQEDGLICQMVKQATNVYAVDFRRPFNIAQAFCFGLAQLDL